MAKKIQRTDAERVKEYLIKNPELITRPVDTIFYRLAEKINGIPQQQVLPRLLDLLMNAEQALIADALPGTAEEIAQKLKMNSEDVINNLKTMYEKGLVMKEKDDIFSFVRPFFKLHDVMGMSRSKFTSDEPFKLLLIYQELEGSKETKAQASVGFGLRVIPRWEAVKDMPGIDPHEMIPHILKSAKMISLLECPCANQRPDRDCSNEVPIQKCISLAESSSAYVERGLARKITLKEAREYLDKLAYLDVIHMAPYYNSKTPLPIHICNCCPCCCGLLVHGASITKSRFRSVIDPEKCTGNQDCVLHCPAGAISMNSYNGSSEQKALVDEEKCIGCGLCVLTCKNKAFKLKIVGTLDEPATTRIAPQFRL